MSKDLCPKSNVDIAAMKKMYLMVSNRPDIAYVVSVLSRYSLRPAIVVPFLQGTGFKKVLECVINGV